MSNTSNGNINLKYSAELQTLWRLFLASDQGRNKVQKLGGAQCLKVMENVTRMNENSF